MNLRECLVAIPALNEENTIVQVINEIKESFPSLDVVVINDGSTDQTSNLALEVGATVLDMPFNVGVGGAMRTAFQYGLENGYKYVIQFDADGQHDCDSIQRLIDVSMQGDVIVGSRFNSESKFQMSFFRELAVRILRFLVRRSVHSQISDPTSGFRMANQKAMIIFAEGYPTAYLGDTVGSLILAGQCGLKVIETNVIMHERQGGKASQNLPKLFSHLLRVVLLGLLFLINVKISEREK